MQNPPRAEAAGKATATGLNHEGVVLLVEDDDVIAAELVA
jgi:hypothetical protein